MAAQWAWKKAAMWGAMSAEPWAWKMAVQRENWKVALSDTPSAVSLVECWADSTAALKDTHWEQMTVEKKACSTAARMDRQWVV